MGVTLEYLKQVVQQLNALGHEAYITFLDMTPRSRVPNDIKWELWVASKSKPEYLQWWYTGPGWDLVYPASQPIQWWSFSPVPNTYNIGPTGAEESARKISKLMEDSARHIVNPPVFEHRKEFPVTDYETWVQLFWDAIPKPFFARQKELASRYGTGLTEYMEMIGGFDPVSLDAQVREEPELFVTGERMAGVEMNTGLTVESSPSMGTVSSLGLTAQVIKSAIEDLEPYDDAFIVAEGGKASAYRWNYYLENSSAYPGIPVGPGELGISEDTLLTLEEYASKVEAYLKSTFGSKYGPDTVEEPKKEVTGPAYGQIVSVLKMLWVQICKFLFSGRQNDRTVESARV